MIHLFEKVRELGHAENLQKADFTETEEEVVNPDRGIFQIFPFVLGEETDCTGLADCLLPSERLAHVIISIEKYKGGAMPDEALAQMREILNLFVGAGKDIILRVVYDNAGAAMEKEPGLFATVSAHMEQVAEVVAEYGEKIFVYQGVLIGNWGEMHGSRYLHEKYTASLLGLLRDRVKGELFFAVRTPEHLKRMVGCAEWNENAFRQIGLFDDAILGSITDCGTYSAQDSERSAQIGLVQKLGTMCPIGGEVILGEGYVESLPAEKVIAYLTEIHVTYLNRQHDIRVWEHWKNVRYRDRTLYDYIVAHLGYRYLVKDIKKKGSELTLSLQNTGFAPVYRQTKSFLRWEGADGSSGEIPVGLDLKGIVGQGVFTAVVKVDPPGGAQGPFRWSLLTRRAFDGAVIRFANRQTEDGSVYLGEW